MHHNTIQTNTPTVSWNFPEGPQRIQRTWWICYYWHNILIWSEMSAVHLIVVQPSYPPVAAWVMKFVVRCFKQMPPQHYGLKRVNYYRNEWTSVVVVVAAAAAFFWLLTLCIKKKTKKRESKFMMEEKTQTVFCSRIFEIWCLLFPSSFPWLSCEKYYTKLSFHGKLENPTGCCSFNILYVSW